VRVRKTACKTIFTGSGFILNAHTIVTNWHVVEGYSSLEVTTSDGRDITVESVSDSEAADIATITTVEALDPAAPLADEDPQLGEFVALVGFPLGEEMTTTTGSVLQRGLDDITPTVAHRADHVFMVSAAARDGSSGSAAYDGDGRVFGVLYGGQTDEPFYGFIIPISIVGNALDSLRPLAAAPACAA
jgi:S1-C subfamily serine protease